MAGLSRNRWCLSSNICHKKDVINVTCINAGIRYTVIINSTQKKEIKKPIYKEKEEPIAEVTFKRQNLDAIDTKIHFNTPAPTPKAESAPKKVAIEKILVEQPRTNEFNLSGYILPSSDLLKPTKEIDLSYMGEYA